MYFAPLIALFEVCGVPVVLVAAMVFVGRLVYVALRPR
jgi:hypothetical protein